MSGRPWHEESPTELDRLRQELARSYPTLHVFVYKTFVIIRGTFPVEHDGREIDRLKVEVVIPPGFPKSPPIVFETGGRIPRTFDRHIFSDAGGCCLFYPDAFKIRYPNGMPFLEFLRGPVRDYFLGQLAVEDGKPWPFGHLGHGIRGGVEFYEGELGVQGNEAVIKLLYCLSMRELKGHHVCPCRSGRRLRNCCRERVEGLRKRIPQDVALTAIRRLTSQNAKGESR
jgi:hypothetical protein